VFLIHITGVSNPEKIEQDFTTILRNGAKFNKKIIVKSKKYNFNDKKVLAFYISPQSSKDKPIYFNSLKNTFIRTASGQHKRKLILFIEILPMEKKTKKFQNTIWKI